MIRAVREEQELFRQGRAGKGIPDRGSHVGELGADKQLWGYSYLGTAGMKLRVLGCKW